MVLNERLLGDVRKLIACFLDSGQSSVFTFLSGFEQEVHLFNPFLFVYVVNCFTSHFGILADQSPPSVSKALFFDVSSKHEEQVYANVNNHKSAGHIALLELDFKVRLPVCKANEIVEHKHNHHLIKVFHPISRFTL
jgi:hypothetical protein